MPRVARIVVPGVPHHITQRGNNREDVFFGDDDRRVYLELLAAQAERFELTVHGYCLMDNHVHLVATPRGETSLAQAVGRTHFLYTQYVNRLHGRSGHLWQNRFYSCALDQEHLWTALVYVERNPVRARVVRGPWNYRWSSAAAHVRPASAEGLLALDQWRECWTPAKWRKQLLRPEDEELSTRLRLCTHRGRPLGSDRFVSKLERQLGRRLRAMPVGRPRKVEPPKRAEKTRKKGKH
jgi:putative transposase